MKIKAGSRRFVLVLKNFVIKVPKFTNWVAFIRGINENLEERYWYCSESGIVNKPWRTTFLAPIRYADRFGLIVIMDKVDTETRPGSYEDDYNHLRSRVAVFRFYKDLKPENVGYYNNKLVVCDYGYFGGTNDCYIGCKRR